VLADDGREILPLWRDECVLSAAFRRCGRPDLAPLCVKGAAFPPVDGAPVLATVKQTALDCGCGAALGQGVGNAANKGLGQQQLAG
jgi:hypothetical protein